MGLPASSPDRDKLVTELPEQLRKQLKVGAGQFGIGVQTAVGQAVAGWCELESIPATIDTAGVESFATFLPIGQWEEFRSIAQQRRVPLVQSGVAQAVHMWLEANRLEKPPRRDSIILG
ncbi:hypothetical protein [Nocardia sp. CA-135398]|uniref:hypothetical protein n=1 Tax=Nocardia sp. CA-135398 TaxID=3239977 RepID=UPI003D9700B1